MRASFAILPLLALSITAHAATPPTWIEVRSPHFIVATDTGEKQARKLAAQFEQMRAVFQSLFPRVVSEKDSPIQVVAVKDGKEFQALEPVAYLGKGKLDLAGIFMNDEAANYVLLRMDAESEDDHPFETVYHEYTHYILRHAEGMPLWMNEGLAEFYQTTVIEDKDVMLGQASVDNILYLRQSQLLPLATLLSVDHDSPYYHEEEKGSVFYAESWALTHYLMFNDNIHQLHQLRDYESLTSKHVDPVVAAQQAFGDLKKLQAALEAYVRQDSYHYFKLHSPVIADPAGYQLRALPVSEVDAVRGQILVHTQRNDEAAALLTAALAADPNDPKANEAMGYLKFHAGDIAAAKKYYKVAAAQHSESYEVYYFAAVMALQNGDGDSPEVIEANLRMAIKLNPQFAPAYDALASFLASQHKDLDEAYIFTVDAVQMEPENVSYRINTAYVLEEKADLANAIRVLETAKTEAKNAGETDMIQQRIDQIKQQQSWEAGRQKDEGQNAEVMSAGSTTLPGDGSVEVVTQYTGESEVKYPAGDPAGPQHTVKGVLHKVQCSYPSILALQVDGAAGKTTALYTNNYYKTAYSATNFTPKSEMNPCKDIEGFKATVVYAEVKDDHVAGQIVSIELTK